MSSGVDGQTQPGTTDWLTVFVDDQVTVKLSSFADVLELGDCRTWPYGYASATLSLLTPAMPNKPRGYRFQTAKEITLAYRPIRLSLLFI